MIGNDGIPATVNVRCRSGQEECDREAHENASQRDKAAEQT